MTTQPFLTVTHVAALESFLGGMGTVFRKFDEQDSGCISYGLEVAGTELEFVMSVSRP